MKSGTQNHVKVKRLKKLLGIPLYRAVGILETLWLLCQDCCDDGNLGKFTDAEIAEYLEWDGDAAELINALSVSGWLEVGSRQVANWAELRKHTPVQRSRSDHNDPRIQKHTVSVHLRCARLAGVDADLTLEQWTWLLEHFGNKCAYCGRTSRLELEHLTPYTLGGGTTASNVVPACEPCNKRKGPRLPLEFFAGIPSTERR